MLLNFVALPSPRLTEVEPSLHQGTAFLNAVGGLGLALIVLGYVAAAASIAARYRLSSGDVRVQLRWFVYSGVLNTLAIAYAGVAYGFFGVPLWLAVTPFLYTFVTTPVAIGIAILRYRLYSIDLIINRTLVFGTLTAILGAVYAAVVTLLNRLFISVSGSKSDAAYVVTAFVVVIASSPIKDWLQRQVDRRFPHRSPSAVLDEFRGDVEAVVSVIDVHRVARRLLDEAVDAFDARSAALYLQGNGDTPVHMRGKVDGEVVLEVQLRHDGRSLGRLVMGSRRGDIGYTVADQAALQKSADSVGEALALAVHLGHDPLSKGSIAHAVRH